MKKRLIDLTFPIHEGMTTYPVHWHPIVEIAIMGRHGIEGRETRKVLLGTHTGTHCDAPRHFIPNGATVDEIPLDVLVGPATVLDFTAISPARELTVEDFTRQLGTSVPERLIMRFDWSRKWGSLDYYDGYPSLSEAAGQWMVEQHVRLLAMDTPQADHPKNGRGSPKDSIIHKILLGGGVVLVEYLCNLSELRHKEIELIVLPLKIKDGDGAPVRCIAMEADSAL
jgi:kynurenine formamidase